jgi:hypothetical protein
MKNASDGLQRPRRYRTAACLCFAVLLASGRVLADAPTATCKPACRQAYVCVDGQCVSECNPPCGASESCSNGQCVSSLPPAATTIPPALPPAPAAAPPSPYQPAASEPLPSPPAGVHLHDGFFFRIGLGGGHYGFDYYANSGGGYGNVSLGASGVATDLSFGGTLSHFVLGGGIWNFSGTPTYFGTLSNSTVNGSYGTLTVTMVGPFAIWYPWLDRGWNFEFALAYSAAAASKSSPFPTEASSGATLGSVFGAGYEIWIANQWSLGADIQLRWSPKTPMKGSESGVSTDWPIAGGFALLELTCH